MWKFLKCPWTGRRVRWHCVGGPFFVPRSFSCFYWCCCGDQLTPFSWKGKNIREIGTERELVIFNSECWSWCLKITRNVSQEIVWFQLERRLFCVILTQCGTTNSCLIHHYRRRQQYNCTTHCDFAFVGDEVGKCSWVPWVIHFQGQKADDLYAFDKESRFAIYLALLLLLQQLEIWEGECRNDDAIS